MFFFSRAKNAKIIVIIVIKKKVWQRSLWFALGLVEEREKVGEAAILQEGNERLAGAGMRWWMGGGGGLGGHLWRDPPIL